MNEERRKKILMMFSKCPIVSTENVSLFFGDNAAPMKRASWALKQLEEEGTIEGKCRRLGETKVWRLTRKARKELPGSPRAVSFSSAKIDHYISITHMWFTLMQRGNLIRWIVEPRYPFEGGRKYAPDVFFTIKENGKTHYVFTEVQLSPKTTKGWAQKWAVASAFFDSKSFERAAFQDFTKASDGSPLILPSTRFKILVISPQQVDTITAGSKLPLLISRDIKGAPLV